MSQKVLHGIAANITGVPGRAFGWRATRVLEDADSTGFASGGERDREPGLKDMFGDVMVYVTSGTVNDDFSSLIDGSTKAMVLTSESAGTNCNFQFNGLLTVGDFSADLNSNQVCRVGFKKKGALTTSWRTS